MSPMPKDVDPINDVLKESDERSPVEGDEEACHSDVKGQKLDKRKVHVDG